MYFLMNLLHEIFSLRIPVHALFFFSSPILIAVCNTAWRCTACFLRICIYCYNVTIRRLYIYILANRESEKLNDFRERKEKGTCIESSQRFAGVALSHCTAREYIMVWRLFQSEEGDALRCRLVWGWWRRWGLEVCRRPKWRRNGWRIWDIWKTYNFGEIFCFPTKHWMVVCICVFFGQGKLDNVTALNIEIIIWIIV